MPSSVRSALLVAVAALAVQGCGSSPPPAPSCADDAGCPSTARCVAQRCVVNSAPSASVALPGGALETNVVLAFDGSGSSDPDAGDSVTSYSWTFRSVAAQCAPPAVAGTGPTAQVRFACAGRFAVDLSVKDEMLAPSPVATVEFDVAAYSGSPLVVAGADVSIGHACSGTPLLCQMDAPASLSATVTGAIGTVAYHWTALPPTGRELANDRRVVFTPSADDAAPAVAVETDGIGISGDWIFEVEARDEAGLLGTAQTRVSIGNRDPVVAATTVPIPNHAFAGTQLSASGEIQASVTDPDGDPISSRTVTWHHAGDGTAQFTGNDLGSTITFAIVVPYAERSDAAFLIGGTGLHRSVELAVQDVNGAAASRTWPIVVGNRPPVLVSNPAAFSVDHSYDAVAGRYLATASLSTWSDPDGDPLVHVGATGDSACSSIAVSAAGLATASCALAYAGTPAVANFAGNRVVTQRISDFWAEAATSSVSFAILNRAPSITSTAVFSFRGTCTRGTCCVSNGGECINWSWSFQATTKTVPSRFADPDGDPLDVVVGSSGGVTAVQPLVCLPAACDVVLSYPQMSVCGVESATLPLSAGDGAATTTGSLVTEWYCGI